MRWQRHRWWLITHAELAGRDDAALPGRSGSYVLVLGCAASLSLHVGRLGSLLFSPGYYLYVGSALGPGGLRARLGRHWRGGGAARWHIDYLRAHCEPTGAWYRLGRRRLEHRWAAALARCPGLQPVPGFGSSDCRCRSHLFHSDTMPQPERLGIRIDACLCP